MKVEMTEGYEDTSSTEVDDMKGGLCERRMSTVQTCARQEGTETILICFCVRL
jgi:hypothetical protein